LCLIVQCESGFELNILEWGRRVALL
jgi:hypothetical protein